MSLHTCFIPKRFGQGLPERQFLSVGPICPPSECCDGWGGGCHWALVLPSLLRDACLGREPAGRGGVPSVSWPLLLTRGCGSWKPRSSAACHVPARALLRLQRFGRCLSACGFCFLLGALSFLNLYVSISSNLGKSSFLQIVSLSCPVLFLGRRLYIWYTFCPTVPEATVIFFLKPFSPSNWVISVVLPSDLLTLLRFAV